MRLHRCAPTCYGTTHRWCVESCTDWCVIFIPYMAAVIDLCTRMAVGLAGLPRAHDGRPADRRARAVPGARLRRARRDLSFGLRQPARIQGDGRPGARRTAHDVRLPAGETGPRHDNAVAESFLGTFKNETCHPRSFATRKEARLASAGYVEGYHDRRRPHSTIDYHIPAEEMDALFERMDAMVAREEALPLAA